MPITCIFDTANTRPDMAIFFHALQQLAERLGLSSMGTPHVGELSQGLTILAHPDDVLVYVTLRQSPMASAPVELLKFREEATRSTTPIVLLSLAPPATFVSQANGLSRNAGLNCLPSWIPLANRHLP